MKIHADVSDYTSGGCKHDEVASGDPKGIALVSRDLPFQGRMWPAYRP
jgi:hypothetical protein